MSARPTPLSAHILRVLGQHGPLTVEQIGQRIPPSQRDGRDLANAVFSLCNKSHYIGSERIPGQALKSFRLLTKGRKFLQPGGSGGGDGGIVTAQPRQHTEAPPPPPPWRGVVAQGRQYAGAHYEPYHQATHNPATPLRPGADAALQLPSRMGNRLLYRSGAVQITEHGA